MYIITDTAPKSMHLDVFPTAVQAAAYIKEGDAFPIATVMLYSGDAAMAAACVRALVNGEKMPVSYQRIAHWTGSKPGYKAF